MTKIRKISIIGAGAMGAAYAAMFSDAGEFSVSFVAKHEFSTKYILPSSDCEALCVEAFPEVADAQSLRLWENLKLGIIEGHL